MLIANENRRPSTIAKNSSFLTVYKSKAAPIDKVLVDNENNQVAQHAASDHSRSIKRLGHTSAVFFFVLF